MEITTFISILISVVSVSFAIFSTMKNTRRNDMNDYQETFERITRIEVRLEDICRKLDMIMVENSNMDKKVDDLAERVLLLENGTKYANQRFESVEARVKELEEDTKK